MKKIFPRFSAGLVILLALSLVLLFAGTAISMEVTVSGEINDEYQLIARDGTIYEIADTEAGNELVTHIGSVVEVVGTLQEDEEGVKIISVSSFKILEE
ncbi:hypothetical protein ACFL03_06345 [Thermodesulfobacteriota bacterium]